MTFDLAIPFRVTLGVSDEYWFDTGAMSEQGLAFSRRLQERLSRSKRLRNEFKVVYLHSRPGSIEHDGFLLLQAVGSAAELAIDVFGGVSLGLWFVQKIEETILEDYTTRDGFWYIAQAGEYLYFPEGQYEFNRVANSFPKSFRYAVSGGANTSNEAQLKPELRLGALSRRRTPNQSRFGRWGMIAAIGIFGALTVFNFFDSRGDKSSLNDRLLVAETKLEFVSTLPEKCSSEVQPIVFDWNWVAPPDHNVE